MSLSRLLLLVCTLPLGACVEQGWRRHIVATVSTQNGTTPSFSCAATDQLVYKPLGAHNASLRIAGTAGTALCTLVGATVPGEYVVGDAARDGRGSAAVVKAINLHQPVTNLGGAIIFADSWGSPLLTDADKFADAWRVQGETGCATLAHQGPGISLATGCALVGRPHEARTFSFFRYPLRFSVSSLRPSSASTLRLGMIAPSAAEMNATGWPQARHYLPLVTAPTGGSNRDAADDRPAGLFIALEADGNVTLLERRLAGGPFRRLAFGRVPVNCGAMRVDMVAGSVYTSSHTTQTAPPLQGRCVVFCEGSVTPAVDLRSTISSDWMDRDGFGESVGEAVLFLEAAPHAAEGPAGLASVGSGATLGDVTVTNLLNASSAPAVLAPITDQLGTLNWDHGSLGDTHALGVPPFGPNEGVLDVTKPPFDADNTGVGDATLSLQAAIEFSRHNYLAL